MPLNTDRDSLPKQKTHSQHRKPAASASGIRTGQPFNPYKLFHGIFIPEGICRYRGLSPGAKLVYGRFCRYAGEDGKVYPAAATVAAELGVSPTQARAYIHELERQRFIQVEHRSGESNSYVFLWHEALGGAVGEVRKRPAFNPKRRGEPYRKSDTPPYRKSDTPPYRKSDTEESHHQESHGKESPCPHASKQPCKPREHSKPEEPAKPSFSSQNSDDDKNPKPGEQRRQPSLEHPKTDAEAKRLTRLMIEQGPELNADNVLRKIEKQLDSRHTWTEYFEHIQTCTTARKAGGGHYVEQAKRLREKNALPKLDIWAPIEDKRTPRCTKCSGGGMFAPDQFCDCQMGKELSHMAARNARKAAAA